MSPSDLGRVPHRFLEHGDGVLGLVLCVDYSGGSDGNTISVIVAIWLRWKQDKRWWWLALIGGVLAVDVLLGSWLISWEINYIKEAW